MIIIEGNALKCSSCDKGPRMKLIIQELPQSGMEYQHDWTPLHSKEIIEYYKQNNTKKE